MLVINTVNILHSCVGGQKFKNIGINQNQKKTILSMQIYEQHIFSITVCTLKELLKVATGVLQ